MDGQEAGDGAGEIKFYDLTKNTELRIESGTEGEVHVQLEDGSAEIFGAELQKGKRVCVSGQKLAVYTWTGCRLKVEGEPALIYTAEETPMAAYINLHNHLNQQRDTAKAALQAEQAAGSSAAGAAAAAATAGQGASGPRVIIVGATDCGKSTLTKMLLNWGVRSGWEPTFVDLDVGQGSITAPGCISAAPIEAPLDVESGASALDMPLVYFYGHASASDNPELYKFLVDRLAAILDRREASSAHAAASGRVINTLGWVEGLGYELQVHAIHALKADIVVVIDQDRLYNQLQAELKGLARPITVLKLAKSGGVVARDRDERRRARDNRVREYFYGSDLRLQPVTLTARADTLLVFRVGGGPRAPTSALPIGAVSANDPLKVSHATMGPELVQAVLAVSHAPTPDQILSTNVAGFVLVKDVDIIRNQVTILSPCPGALPGRYLVAGSLRTTLD